MKFHCKEICEDVLSDLRLELIKVFLITIGSCFCQTSSRMLTEDFRSLTQYLQQILKYCLTLSRYLFLLRNFKYYFLLSKYFT